ncbi:MAG: DUF4230 domain-containing protein [Bacteroidota bacterium]
MLFRKSYESLSKWSTLIVGVGIFALLLVAIIWGVRYCRNFSASNDWQIEDTALKLESIKEITELCTVSFRDEVIADTIEKYKSMDEQINGNINKLKNYSQWKDAVKGSYIKRRLTMIIGAELRFGFDLKNGIFKIEKEGDSSILTISKPKILDVLITPSKSSVFHEDGEWNDEARRKLQRKAIKEITAYSKRLKLDEKAKKQLESLLSKMIKAPNKFSVKYVD